MNNPPPPQRGDPAASNNDDIATRTVPHDRIFGKPGPAIILKGRRSAISELQKAVQQEDLIVQLSKPQNAGEVLATSLESLRLKDALPSLRDTMELPKRSATYQASRGIRPEDWTHPIDLRHQVNPPFSLKELDIHKTLGALKVHQRLHGKGHVCQVGILSKLDFDDEHHVYLFSSDVEKAATDTMWLFRECTTDVRGAMAIEESWRGFMSRREALDPAANNEELAEPYETAIDPQLQSKRVDLPRESVQSSLAQQQYQGLIYQPYSEHTAGHQAEPQQLMDDLATAEMYQPERFFDSMPNTNIYTSATNLPGYGDFSMFDNGGNYLSTYPQYGYDNPHFDQTTNLNSLTDRSQLFTQLGHHPGWFENTTSPTTSISHSTPDRPLQAEQEPYQQTPPRAPKTTRNPIIPRQINGQPTTTQLDSLTNEEILSGAIDPKYIVGNLILRLARSYSNTEIAERCNAQSMKKLSHNLYTKRITKALKDKYGSDREKYAEARRRFNRERKGNGVSVGVVKMGRNGGRMRDGIRRVERLETIQEEGDEDVGTGGNEVGGRALRSRRQRRKLPSAIKFEGGEYVEVHDEEEEKPDMDEDGEYKEVPSDIDDTDVGYFEEGLEMDVD
ncbi:unnamed protein product [Zymoseptoria tritici ST99CH_3D7]|uniref:Uncharacterized protein n=1 Tax=Zymoseptoria tritici (strain ST99CH_3D7) TaxID=1276538 RepID=A0A1X7S6B3_ZYMT9|nr:unnamed protein product [Zymoseptoria tritici ST99CH_3D7]